MPEIIVLFDGYSRELENRKMEANCSCTLIKGEKKIIVDTMTAWDKEKLIEALASHDIKPEDIDFVVCTHGHADHIGNNNLFTNADHFVGTTFQRGTIFTDMTWSLDEYKICEGVKVIQTEGHTHDDVSLLVKTKIDDKDVTVAIVGDLFEKQEDIENDYIWRNVGIPELWKKQIVNRNRVIRKSDYIVPGHGPMFKITDEMRGKINEDWEEMIRVKDY